MRACSVAALIGSASIFCGSAALAATPSGAHPRLFMSAANQAGFTHNAAQAGTAAAALVAACDDTLTEPGMYHSRGGSDGNYWPNSAVDCAFAYRATGAAKYLTQALLYWQAALDDDQTIGDHLGCVAGVATDWQSWDGTPPAPPILLTISHDTDYPMRWYGPDLALTYDWLYSAPGVSSTLLAQTRTCLTAWSDFYTASGYHAAQAGANYNAGFVAAKALTAIAIGSDGGADGHLWTETGALFENLLETSGLAGVSDPVGQPAGALAGGDWLEGWQYGGLSVLEYAVAARAVEEAGLALPAMDSWAGSLVVRYIHGTVPTLDGEWVGADFDSKSVYTGPLVNVLDATLAGPASDQAAAAALFMKSAQSVTAGIYPYNAIAELRSVAALDYRVGAPLWYLARGSRAVYARTSWDPTAYWGVFSSPPHLVDDHEHFAAGNFVFSRGADALLVDPSNYGEPATRETNAIAADADLPGDYSPSQTPWSTAELQWARGTSDAVYAARSDFAGAFAFADGTNSIPFAERDWAMLPEGEMVTIDRVQTADASHHVYLQFHANTGGTLTQSGRSATGTAGSSTLTVHSVALSGGSPTITRPSVGSCAQSCEYPCGACDSARFAVDQYGVEIPGPWAVAIHVFDGAAMGESATVGSLNDSDFDPAPAQNGAVIGAAIYRGQTQTYVVASSAIAPASPAPSLMYAVPGSAAARHIVFDAPEGASGQSTVVTALHDGRCQVTITAAEKDGFSGHPLMFQVAAAIDGCRAQDSTNAPAALPPSIAHAGGCSLATAPASGRGFHYLMALLMALCAWVWQRRRCRKSRH